jgi:hypothetical protein
MSTLAKDVKFLKKNGLMDYSLFLVKYHKKLVRKEVLENSQNDSSINKNINLEITLLSPHSRVKQ